MVDATSNADWFCEDSLKKYSAVIFFKYDRQFTEQPTGS